MLDALSCHAYNFGLAAFRCQAHEACVMLMSSACVLLKELDAQQQCGSRRSVGQQAQALLVAAQALLDLHASASSAVDRCAVGP